MIYNYNEQLTKILMDVDKLKNGLEDILCYTDKRTKKSKELESLLISLKKFELFSLKRNDKENFDTREIFEIKIDISSLETLQLFKEQMKEKTLSDTLKFFLERRKNNLTTKHFIKIDDLIDTKEENKNIINSQYIEKFVTKDKLRILFSLDDIIIYKQKRYLNPINFFFFSKEKLGIDTYVSEYIPLAKLDKFYNLKDKKEFMYQNKN